MKFLRKLFLQTWGTNEKNTFLNIVGTEKNPPFYSIGSVRTQPWPIWQFIKTRRTIWPTIFVGLALSFQIPDDGQQVAGVCEPHAVSDMRPFHRRAMSQVRSRNPLPPAWTDNKLLNEEGKSLTLSLSGLTESWRRVIITVVDTKTDGQRSLCLQRSSAVTAWLTGRSRYQLITCYCRTLRGFIQQEREFHCQCMNMVQNSKCQKSHISTIFTMLHRLRVDPGSDYWSDHSWESLVWMSQKFKGVMILQTND